MPDYTTTNNEVLDLNVPPTEAEITLEPETPAPTWEDQVALLPEEPERLSSAFDLFVTSTGAPVRRDRFACTCTVCRRDAVRPTVEVFFAAVRTATDDEAVLCEVCVRPTWAGEASTDVSDRWCCQTCIDNGDTSSCHSCGEWSVSADFTSYVGDHPYCTDCLSENFFWCEDCDEYVDNDDRSDHRHGDCDCAPLPLSFWVPGNSHGPLAQDERLHVQLPEGFISDEAMEAVYGLLWNSQFRQLWIDAGHPYEPTDGVLLPDDLRQVLESLERVWQTRQGNFTRRLSKALHQKHRAKLNDGLLSRVGAVVRDHSIGTSEWYVEFTRDLNLPPGDFYHEDSCWWGGEGQSRCALKHWGGFAMRSYRTEDQPQYAPEGRAWVQPLDENLQPISDALNAPAYVVYNGYGDLQDPGRGYTGARLMAYLASKTYRKVGLSISHQWINSATGFLIADQELCDATPSLHIGGLDIHTPVPFTLPEMAVSA